MANYESVFITKNGSYSAVTLGMDILQNCRNELYSYFPYLDAAFASVSYTFSRQVTGVGTDGESFLFVPDYLIKEYMKNAVKIKRGYLHMLLHCLYLHIFPEAGYEKSRWNLACDLAVEKIIEREQIDALALPYDEVRELTFYQMGDRSLSVQDLYHMLERRHFTSSESELMQAFSFDDHSIWHDQTDRLKIARTKSKWEKIQKFTGQNKQNRRQRRGNQWGDEEEELQIVHKSKYDYRKFLRRFSIPREEVELDTESFDYIFYNYGMEHYGNMPLIEPLEYKEVNRLEELVIAIDTSSSCSKETVQQFLAETYEILSQRENFFKKMKVYLIQCDCYVQEAVVIHSEEEWKNYNRSIKIQGRGGTDFRPVFRYIEEQKAKKEIRQLKALIYFTDGDGIYPQSKPEYETAFVFLKETQKMELVPPWALKLITT